MISRKSNNNARISPICFSNDPDEKTQLDLKKFEASKISLIRMEQADQVDRLLECIRDNDGPGADEFLGEMSQSERRELLCEPVLSQGYDEKPSKDNFYRKMDYSWLTVITAGAGSDTVFEVLVKYGAPLDVTEADGSNIGHAVAYGSYFMPEFEVEFVRIYFHFVAKIGNLGVFRNLMLTEDGTGSRPLELAAVLGKFEIFHAMIETENLYKTIEIRQGTWNRAVYDFSEYERAEPSGRRGKSPLKIFTFLQEKDLDSPGFRRVFQSPAITGWIAQHVNTTRLILLLWFAIRTAFTGIYLSVLARVRGIPVVTTTTNNLSQTVNVSTCPPAYKIVLPGDPAELFAQPELVFLWMCIVSFMVFDLGDALYYLVYTRKRQPFFQRPENNGPYIVHTLDHRALQVIFILNIFVTLLMRNLHLEAIMYSYVFSILIASMTYMYFLQFLPGIGYLVIGLQRSMATFGSFSAIFFLIFISFSLAFYILNQICCVDFTMTQSIYQTFQIFLNQVNILKDFECEWYRREAWTVFHILYVMFMVILLLNFCIAILSESAIRITNHKDILQDLQYLNASIVIEDRIGFVARPVRSYLWKDKFEFGVIKASAKLRQPFAMK